MFMSRRMENCIGYSNIGPGPYVGHCGCSKQMPNRTQKMNPRQSIMIRMIWMMVMITIIQTKVDTIG